MKIKDFVLQFRLEDLKGNIQEGEISLEVINKEFAIEYEDFTIRSIALAVRDLNTEVNSLVRSVNQQPREIENEHRPK